MRRTALEGLLNRYGQRAEIVRGNGTRTAARAFIQPVRESREAQIPSPLGVGRQDRFLYLGEPGVPLDGPEGCYVRWQGRRLEVVNAQAIYIGDEPSHWRAVLTAGDEVME